MYILKQQVDKIQEVTESAFHSHTIFSYIGYTTEYKLIFKHLYLPHINSV